MKKVLVIFLATLLVAFVWLHAKEYDKTIIDTVRPRIVGARTVTDVLKKYENNVVERLNLKNNFPKKLLLFADKTEMTLSLYGKFSDKENFFLIKKYPFTATSGKLGPKLKEGDCQIPEGVYKMESLNPNSSYHLSLRVNYPNEFDKEMAKKDGRDIKNLGSDIMIHGRNVTIGCIPIGDIAIEEVFVLAAKSGIGNVDIVISPKSHSPKPYHFNLPDFPSWYPDLLFLIDCKTRDILNLGD